METKEKTQAPAEARSGLSALYHRYQELTHDVRRGFIAEWTVTIVLLLFATTALVQAFVIPSASMEDTLLIGDHVLVDKLVFAPHGSIGKAILPYRDVRRGDIIVFRYPMNIKEDYVKRAIGVPGDHIKLVNKQLFLNGHAVYEPYVKHIYANPVPYRDNFPNATPEIGVMQPALDMLQNNVVNGEVVVPPGSIFAMGDNRDDSADSRYWGFVPRANIEGTPLIIYWSFEAPTADLTNGNIGFDHIMDVITHFFTKTRWSRTFKIIRGYPLK
ncbi:MAG TPA: signal peptidase I [Bryobacteraceae bacterium]|nr:signal peptidase I [Bryobacteraceae bacterium]